MDVVKDYMTRNAQKVNELKALGYTDEEIHKKISEAVKKKKLNDFIATARKELNK